MARQGRKRKGEGKTLPAGQQVWKRSVFMIGGYEPKSSDAFYLRTERELKRFCETWDVRAQVLSKGDQDKGRIANIAIATDHGNGSVETNWNFFVWNDIVLGDFAKPFWYRIGRYWLTFADYVLSGTFFRILFMAWRFGLYFLYPAVMHLVFGLFGWLAGWLIAQADFPGSLWAGWAVGIAVALGLWHTVGERYFVRHLGDLWAFSRNFIWGYRKDAEAALDHLARRIVDRWALGADDEILLVGHSTGGGLILDAAARALALNPSLGVKGPRIQILTVGSTALKIGLHPAARDFRARVQTLVDAPQIRWSEWQAMTDIINLYKSDPVKAMGLTPRPRTAGAGRFPRLAEVRIRDMLLPEAYNRVKRNFFRVHYQFIMGNTQRYAQDFYMACCGPHFLQQDRKKAEHSDE